MHPSSKNLSRHAQSGFTLIELVIVIIILGILAALAIPRFINLQRDARVAVLEATRSSLRSAATMTFSRATITGTAGAAAGTTDIDPGATTTNVATNFGYPQATAAALGVVLDPLSARLTYVGGAAAAGSTISLRIDNIVGCQVDYQTPAVAGGVAVITVNAAALVAGGCL